MRKTKKIQLLKMIMAVLGAYIGLGVSFSCASEYISTLGNDSAYTFKATDVSANNTVTVYDYNKEKGIVEAINYELGIKNTEYGKGTQSKIYSNTVLEGYDVEFIGKYSIPTSSNINIGSVDNSSKNYEGEFVDLKNPKKYSGRYWYGGAISLTNGKMGNISGIFLGNNTNKDTLQAWGGAILARGSVSSIKADFLNNYSYSVVEAVGGAIGVVQKNVGSITGDFIGNYAQSEYSSGGYGGAIYIVVGSVDSVNGNFIGNYTKSDTVSAYGGAINVYRDGLIKEITGDFIGNYAKGTSASGGGAVEIHGRSDKITGDFIGNYAKSINSYAYGGAVAFILHSGSVNNYGMGELSGNFIENYVDAHTYARGGAIYVDMSTDKIKANFYGNSVISKENSLGGAVYNSDKINNLEGDFIANTAKAEDGYAYGGAIYSEGEILNPIKGSFLNNFAVSKNSQALGGAIFTSKDLSFVADNKDMVVAGNYTISNGVKDDNAFYVNSADATLDFELKNDAEFILKDNIDGLVGYNVNIKGDNKNTLYLHNDIRNADVSFDNVNIDGVDGKAQIFNFNSLQLGSSMDFVADIDFEKETMDSFRANNTYTLIDGVKLNVSELNWINEPVKDKTSILFAEEGLKENVTYSGISKIVTPVYIYNIAYENKEDAGYFVVSRGSGMSGLSGYNPTAVTSSVSSTVGAVSTLNQALSYSFQNSDNYMSLSSVGRVLHKYNDEKSNISMNSGDFSPLYTKYGKGNVWMKPYALFEDVNLKNGTKVSNNVYGTLVGYDTGVREINDEWDGAITGYIGYSGATQKYGGIKSKQKGGVVGGTLTLYKGDLFNAITMSLGALDSEDETLYGEDSYTVLLGGVGNKIGYNFEFENGKFIIQPSLLLSYTAVNAFDYTNVLGAKVKNDQVNSFQFSPGVKFIANLTNGWQPYASISRYWNLDGKSDSTVNGVRIPQMSIKPYWEYGLGVQRSVKDNFMAYGQSMFESGGRKGVALTAGIRWSFDYK